MKKIVVDNFKYECHFGDFIFNDVTVYVEDSGLNADNFDQEKDDYSLLGDEIDRLEHLSVGEFIKQNFDAILKSEKDFTQKSLRGFLTYTRLKAAELSKLTGHTKGTISKMLKEGVEEYQIKKVTSHFLISLLVQEYRERGFCRRLLGIEAANRTDDKFPFKVAAS